MDKLRGLEIFMAVGRSRSFSNAARQLGMSRGYVTKYIVWLEETLGARLLTRTTRSVGLTQAGMALMTGGRDLLDRFEAISQELRASTTDLQGTIRIGVPPSFGAIHLVPLVAGFAAARPGVQVEMCLDTGTTDIASEGLDFSVRLAPDLRDSTHVAQLLTRVPQLLVAAPAYLARMGTPQKPADLEHHACLIHTIKAPTGAWSFTDALGVEHVVRVQGPIRSNFGDILLNAALAGEGIAMHHKYMVDAALAAKRLKVVLTDYRAEDVEIYAIYPTRKRMPARVRALLNFLVAQRDFPPVTALAGG